MTRIRIVLALTFIAAAVVGAQSRSTHDVITGCLPLTVEDGASFHPPALADYPVRDDFQGRPAPVDLASHPLAPRFRTRLREAADGGPNFARHYTIASWGCGSGCVQYAIVDARIGRVFFPPEVQFVEMMRVVGSCRARMYCAGIFAATARCSLPSGDRSPANPSTERTKESSITAGRGPR